MILKGNPVSPGIALGEIYVYRPFRADVQPTFFQKDLAPQMKDAFDAAVGEVEKDLTDVMVSFGEDRERAKIFLAHREILYDEEISEMVSEAILTDYKMPDLAVMETFHVFIELLENSKDPLIAARAADFRDVRNRLIRVLHGEKEKSLAHLEGPVIVVAQDLLPSDTATLDRKNVLGIITEVGSSTSHSAILANSYRIPAVLGVPGCTAALSDGLQVGLDALTGEIHIEPDSAVNHNLCQKLTAFERRRAKEENPFLGKRALRLCLSAPELFRPQLRAALRASVHGELWVMLPMVGSIDDIIRGREIFDSVQEELALEGIPTAKTSNSVL